MFQHFDTFLPYVINTYQVSEVDYVLTYYYYYYIIDILNRTADVFK